MPPLGERLGRALPLLAVLALAAALRLGVSRAAYEAPPARGDEEQYYALGSDLSRLDGSFSSHRHHGEEAFRALLYPGLIATIAVSWPPLAPGKVRLGQSLLGAFAVLLVFCLGARLHSPLAGLAAACLLALDSADIEAASTLNIHSFFSFLVLIVAWALAEWTERPSEPATLRLGLSIGLSLACRSTLCVLPFFLLSRLAMSSGGLKRRARLALILAAGCAAPVLPWAARNLWHLREFVLFERHALAVNLFTASHGIVETIENSEARLMAKGLDPRLAGASVEAYSRAMRRMALDSMRRDPVAHAGHALQRLGWLIGRYVSWFSAPFLLALGLGILSALRRPPAAGVTLLWAYFFLVHAPASVNALYLLETIPLACVLAGCGAAAAAGWCSKRWAWPLSRSPWLSRDEPSGAPAVLAAGLLAGGVYAASLVFLAGDAGALAFPEQGRFSAAQRCALYGARGQALFERRDRHGALGEWSRAIEACPGSAAARQNRAVLLALMGRDREAVLDYGAVERLAGPGPGDRRLRAEMLSSRARSWIALGQGARALQDLRRCLREAPRDWERRSFVEREILLLRRQALSGRP